MGLSVEKAVRAVFNANDAAFGNKFTDLYLGRVGKGVTGLPWAEFWAPTAHRSYTTSDTIGICKDLQFTFYARTLEEIADDDNPLAYAVALKRIFNESLDLSQYGLGLYSLQIRWTNDAYFQDDDRVYHYSCLYEMDTFEQR